MDKEIEIIERNFKQKLTDRSSARENKKLRFSI